MPPIKRAAPRRAGVNKVNLKTPAPIKLPWGNEGRVEDIDDSVSWDDTGNCGLGFASGMGEINSVEDAFALRRAAAVKQDFGCVMVTTIPRQQTAIRHLRAAGFEQLCQFKNPNTPNVVTVWAALAIPED